MKSFHLFLLNYKNKNQDNGENHVGIILVDKNKQPQLAQTHFVIGHQNGFGWTKDGLVFP